jgi:hypothetical protein
VTPIAATLAALSSLLRERLGVPVPLGRPAAQAELSLWPWHLAEVPRTTNAPSARLPSGEIVRPGTIVEIRFLLVSNGTERSIERLAAAQKALAEAPVLQVAGTTVQLVGSPMAPAELAAVFSAAQVPLNLSSSFSVRCVL